jgi:hypothetical protein
VSPDATGVAAVLPGRVVAGGDVAALLGNSVRGLPAPAAVSAESAEPYDEKMGLDFLGQPTVSGSVTPFGTRIAGGISAVFSDMLGDRALGVQAQVGGTLADFGGELVYLNRRRRWNWTAALVSSPVSYGYLTRRDDPATGRTTISEVIERQTVRGAFVSVAYPFSMSTRLEVSGGAQARDRTRETRSGVYATATRTLIDTTREVMPIGPTLHLGQASVAIVTDRSFYGATAPVYGARSRFELGRSVGTVQYTSILADWRRYYMPVRPLTIAVRALHMGRYGRNAEHDQLIDLYAGYPELVHGYSPGSFAVRECLDGDTSAECDAFRNLLGSRMAVVNAEVRVPIPGVFRGELEYGRVPVDAVFFADTGLVWTAGDRPEFAGGTRRPVRSVGGAIHVNVFGLLAVELSASRPLDRVNPGVRWQVGIRQGF